MNPFEKIFNYQIVARLHDSGTFVVTSHERRWLKTMLQHPAAEAAFLPLTLEKLRQMVEPDSIIHTTEYFIQKAVSRETHVYHPFIRSLRTAILNKRLVSLSYGIKRNRSFLDQTGLPYKLEYSMVKREWSLLWYHIRDRRMMSTKLQKLTLVHDIDCSVEVYEQVLSTVHMLMEKRRISAEIKVIKAYNEELSRILYAFSCFEKEVRYCTEADEYTIKLHFASNEREYVLSKARFLGKRVQIMESEYMRHRMLESSSKALGRYAEAAQDINKTQASE